MKICATCGKEKTSDEFHRDVRNQDGLRNTCKQCSILNKNYKEHIDAVYEKTCIVCKRVRPLEQFIRDSRRTLGYGMKCLDCSRLKLCRKCSMKKDVSQFPINLRSSDGFGGSCKECVNARTREWYKNGGKSSKMRSVNNYRFKKGTKEGTRERMLMRNYGLTLEDYEKMLKEQEYRCKICNYSMGERGRTYLAVDHDKESGKVRGLLCDPCNRAIGMLKHDPVIIESAKQYLLHAHFG